jgi:hypothetical protein
MILWDALPVGATAELTFSGVDADAVLGLAALRGGPDVLQLSADGALECTAAVSRMSRFRRTTSLSLGS